MVVSVNNEPHKEVFADLLKNTLAVLHKEAESNPKKYKSLLGTKLENEVKDVMADNAVGTPFENSIELVSGQKFPDIVANRFYGVEVKTTKSNQWKSVGSSVAEGTREKDVERIFMLFGKMCDPISFMCRPYEECLSEVVVTHSPRYMIDMDLQKGETIFDKIAIPYDEVRKKDDPITPFLDYYRKNSPKGGTAWWAGNSYESNSGNFLIKLWNQLEIEEKDQYRVKAFCLFPEIFGNSSLKFDRLAIWLSSKGVVNKNIRDVFSAGGQESITFNDRIYKEIPQIICRMKKYLPQIKETLQTFEPEELSTYWNIQVTPEIYYQTWINLISKEASKIIRNEFPISDYLFSM